MKALSSCVNNDGRPIKSPSKVLCAKCFEELNQKWKALLKGFKPKIITQEIVNDSMNNAIDNGYNFDGWTAKEIARDIAEYDSRFEGVNISDYSPFIWKWKENNE